MLTMQHLHTSRPLTEGNILTIVPRSSNALGGTVDVCSCFRISNPIKNCTKLESVTTRMPQTPLHPPPLTIIMTLPQPQPPAPMSLDLDTKPRLPLAPNSLISSSSSSVIGAVSAGQLSDDEVSLSDSETLSSSMRSDSETYINDIGGQCIRDKDWPEDLVSRVDAYRVYDSTDDEAEALRREARVFLESADIGIYDEWAEIADDQLSLEDLQQQADEVTEAIEAVSMSTIPPERYDQPKRRPRPHIPLDNQPVVTSIESLEDDVVSSIPLPSAKPPRRRKGHRRVETLPDDDLSIPWNAVTPVEGLPDSDDIDLPPLPPVTPLSKTMKRGHRRIETLPDTDALDMATQPRHRRVETLPDVDALETPTPPPLKRIETLTNDGGLNMPSPPPLPTPPSMTTPSSLGGIETLPDVDMDTFSVPTPPGHRRIETLPDIDSSNSELLQAGGQRESDKDYGKMDTGYENETQRIESLPEGEPTCCARIAELSERVEKVTRGLADIQMITAGQAASAEACLGKTSKTSLRSEVCTLRITLDHLAKLTLERAYKARDEADRHGHG